MATYTLNNSAGDIDDALQKVVAVTTTPLDNSPNMVTSGGVKAYVDAADTALETQILVIESKLQNPASAVSFKRTAEFSTKLETYQTVPLTVTGQPDFFTNNGSNTFTILEGNYLMWLSFNYKTQYPSFPTINSLYFTLTTVSGMADFANIGVFTGESELYANEALLKAELNIVDQTTTFKLQIKDESGGSGYFVYVKDVVFTILKV